MENHQEFRIPEMFVAPVHEEEFKRYMLDVPGREHYPLLYQISQVIQEDKGAVVMDIGTYKGCSALALSANPIVNVISVDLQNTRILYPEPENVSFAIGDIFTPTFKPFFEMCSFILLDTDHEGSFEQKFVEYLDEIKYNGIVMFDDIHLNDEMKQFWSKQQATRTTMDITKIGHWSGTGIIIYGK